MVCISTDYIDFFNYLLRKNHKLDDKTSSINFSSSKNEKFEKKTAKKKVK